MACKGLSEAGSCAMLFDGTQLGIYDDTNMARQLDIQVQVEIILLVQS